MISFAVKHIAEIFLAMVGHKYCGVWGTFPASPPPVTMGPESTQYLHQT